MKSSILLLTAVAILMVACSSNGRLAAPGDDMASVNVIPNYVVGPDDTLEINVWGNSDLSVSVPVRPDGRISMPLVGDIEVGGMTPEHISDLIEEELSTFIKSPNVSVIVTDMQSTEYMSRVRVTGAVVTNISISHRQGMTVLDAVLEAGGVNEYAAANKTYLYRNTVDGRQAYIVRLDDILRKGDISTNYELAPGDIITVPERLF